MKEFKIGGKVTISENEIYRIIDIVNINGKKYYLSSMEQKNSIAKVFEVINDNNDTYIKIIEDPIIIKEVAKKVIESVYGKSYGNK